MRKFLFYIMINLIFKELKINSNLLDNFSYYDFERKCER